MNYMDFRRKIATDRQFSAKFKNVRTVEALITTAAEEGCTFTEEDIRNHTDILPEELANAVGGIGSAPGEASNTLHMVFIMRR